MIKVFKTDIAERNAANFIINMLLRTYTNFKITIDTDDCDNVLRVEGHKSFSDVDIVHKIKRIGFFCEEME